MDPTRLKLLGLIALWFSSGACTEGGDSIVLGATTSTYDSGLLEHVVSVFRAAHPELRVRTVVSGSGEALELARRGDVDVLLVHAPEAENRFIDAGHASERQPVMYNDFMIVGPPGDPAGIAGERSAVAAMARIASSRAPFISRGDSSGTHYREVALWTEADVRPSGDWYVESGQGQATSLQVASERAAYTLTDGATFAVLGHVLELEPIVTGSAEFTNIYSVLIPTASTRGELARVFADWLLSEAGQSAIDGFRIADHDVPPFTPWGSGTPAPEAAESELEDHSVLAPDSIRGSAARGSPANHFG